MRYPRYALISDIHGNAAALDAVLKHAQRQGAAGIIFLGDYCGLGKTNEIAEILQKLMVDNSHAPWGGDMMYAVSGNGEGYIRTYYEKANAGKFTKQYAPIHYECTHINPLNKSFFLDMPQVISAVICGQNLKWHMHPRIFLEKQYWMK